MAPKYILKKKEAIILMGVHDGNKTEVCRQLEINRSTLYKWLKQPLFKKQYTEMQQRLQDIMESKLIKEAKSGNMTALIYWLKNNHPNYYEKQKQSINVDKMQVNVINYAKNKDNILSTNA